MNKISEEIFKDFFTVRTFITLGAFGTVYWLCWTKQPVPDVILRIVDLLLGFWFGSKVSGKKETEQKGA
jgi:hypothetical protein